MSLGLAMIVRNEEVRLGEMLGETALHVDDVVVVDTGSTDKTMDVATRQEARVFQYNTTNLAAARNYSVEQSTSDWILFLDADERVTEDDFEKIREIVRTDERTQVYSLGCFTYTGGGNWAFTAHPRLIRPTPSLYWFGEFHETLMNSIEDHGHRHELRGDIRIRHLEMAGPDHSEVKRRRNIERISVALETDKRAPGLRCLLALDYFALGEVDTAIALCKLAYDQDPGNPFSRRFLGYFYSWIGDLARARENFELRLKQDPEDRYAAKGLADVAAREGRLDECFELTAALLRSRRSSDSLINHGLANYLLGKEDTANGLFRAALEDDKMLLDQRIYLPGHAHNIYAPQSSLLSAYAELGNPLEFWQRLSRHA